MPNNTNGSQMPISPDLLETLRDPQAIQEGAIHGSDPGRLELVHNSWLVSADTGYKYPIRDGIPVMLIEEGARWKDTSIEALPVPPPAAEPAAPTLSRAAETTVPAPATGPDYRLLLVAAAIVLLLLALVGIGRKRSANNPEQTPGA